MKRKIALLLICFFLFVSHSTLAEGIPTVNAEAALLLDLNTGQILYEKDIHKKLAPASTTKVLTALIVLERCKLDDIVTVGKNPPFEDGSKIYLAEGETITVKNLLYAMMLDSANDAALAFAEHISGSKEAFAILMNAKAKELGCKDSNFVNPNGLYDDNHYTTAYDLALISKKAMENPILREIVSTRSYKIAPTNKQPEIRYIHNRNKIIGSNRYKYEGADGLKNGYTEKSKNTLLASASRGGRRLLAVELKDDHYIYNDAIKLLDYGFNQFRSESVLSTKIPEMELKISGTNESIPLYPQRDYNISALNNASPSISKEIELNKNLKEISKGDIVGYVKITLSRGIETKIPLVSGGEYKSITHKLALDKENRYKKILKPIIKYPLYIILFISLFLIYAVIRVKRNRALRYGKNKKIKNFKYY